MEDFFIDFGFSTIFTLLKTVVKNPVSKARYESVLRKIRDRINAAYPEWSEES